MQITNPILGETPTHLNWPIPFLQAFLPKLITISLIIAAIVFVFVMLVSGISWMLSGGDKQKIEEARSRLTNGLVGFIIVLSVFAITGVIEVLFGINILELEVEKLIVQ